MTVKIIFNDKSNEDLNLGLIEFKPQPPSPKIIKQEVPFMNGAYDFSSLYGEQSYNERIITCKLQLVCRNKDQLYTKYSQVLEWLLGSGKARLEYTNELGLYYTARVENAPSWDMFFNTGIFEIEFIAYPFKTSIDTMGSYQTWDTFNFKTDIMQETIFDVITTKAIQIYNTGATKIIPSIICSTNMSIIKNGVTYNFVTGTTKNYKFELVKGLNNMVVNNSGKIEFVFKKEVF